MARSLNVVDRGSFFDDSFFRESWGDFDSAMQRVLDKFDNQGLKVGSGSRTQCQDAYRKIRTNKINDDVYASQAVQVTEKDGNFQAVMDVKDFNPRELQVRAVDNRIVVEGSFEKRTADGSSSTSKAFFKEITMPPEADIDLVNTALSKDGILTVRAPKKEGAAVTTGPKTTSNESKSVQESFNQQNSANGLSSFKSASSKSVLQSSSFESTDSGMESLPRDMKERLMFSDGNSVSGRSSSCMSSCASPAPSETFSDAPSEGSRVSTTMEFDIGNKAAPQRSEVTFNVAASPTSSYPSSSYPTPNATPTPFSTPNYTPVATPAPTQTPTATPTSPQTNGIGTVQKPIPANIVPVVGSGATSSVTVTDEDGRRVLTSETSNVIQEKDGFMETRETAAEISEKDSQAARREGTTRIMRSEEDPAGRFKHSEKADASDVSESCIQQLPDGSTMKVNKSSTSSSNFKQSCSNSSGPDATSLIGSGFPDDFGDLRSLMGRGHNLMSQMSNDSMGSMGSMMSGRSAFTDMPGFSDTSSFSNFSGFPTRSNMSNMSNMSSMSNRSNMSDMSNRSNMSDMSNLSNMSNLPHLSNMSNKSQSSQISNQSSQMSNQDSNMSKTSKSSFSSSSSSSFSQSSFSSSFDDMKF